MFAIAGCIERITVPRVHKSVSGTLLCTMLCSNDVIVYSGSQAVGITVPSKDPSKRTKTQTKGGTADQDLVRTCELRHLLYVVFEHRCRRRKR